MNASAWIAATDNYTEATEYVIHPHLLDIALLETRVRFDEIRAEADRSRSEAHIKARTVLVNDALVSDTVSTFLSFLFRLLPFILSPWIALTQLESQLDIKFGVLRSVIASNKQVASDLELEKERGQDASKDLKLLEDFIKAQIAVSIKNTGTQSSSFEDVEISKQDMVHTKLEV